MHALPLKFLFFPIWYPSLASLVHITLRYHSLTAVSLIKEVFQKTPKCVLRPLFSLINFNKTLTNSSLSYAGPTKYIYRFVSEFTMDEDIAVTKFRDYLKIRTEQPNPDYGESII